MKIGELKLLLAQYDDEDEVMKVDPTGQGTLIPGRVQLKKVHVWQFKNDLSPMMWYSTDKQVDNPPEQYVVRDFDGVFIQFV